MANNDKYTISASIIDLDTQAIEREQIICVSDRDGEGWERLQRLQFWAINNNKGVAVKLDKRIPAPYVRPIR